MDKEERRQIIENAKIRLDINKEDTCVFNFSLTDKELIYLTSL
tara:strand:- start:5 stop:133 length:129 start_codon:yes stop_codon:yes gene_type:complete